MSIIFKNNKFIDSDIYIEQTLNEKECIHAWRVIINKDYYLVLCDLEKDIHDPLTFKCMITTCNMIRCYNHLPDNLKYFN